MSDINNEKSIQSKLRTAEDLKYRKAIEFLLFHSVDEYGFERKAGVDYSDYENYMSEYLRVLTIRGRKWESLVGNKQNVNRSRKLKRYVRKGIPLKYRAKVWMSVSGAKAKKDLNAGYYASLLRRSKDEDLIDSIKVDLPRTFPNNIYFKGGQSEKVRSLSNILLAYGCHNPSVGYCQGMNYVAGLMLLIIGDEENVFWLLTTLLEDIVPEYYSQNMSGVVKDIYVLGELLRERKPLIFRHLNYFEIELSMVVTKWFVCLYIEVLPIETVLRVWDCVFYEGGKVLMRTALALIISNEELLFRSQDLDSIIYAFKSIVIKPNVLHCHNFMTNVFEITNPLSRTHIDELREKGRKVKYKH